MRRLKKVYAPCLGAAVLMISSLAPAQPKSESSTRAQALFDEAMTLMKASKFADACPKLEQSQKLDPGMGTEYRLAECYENAGWLAQAWKLFTRVAEESHDANRKDREKQSRDHADALRPRLPMMTLTISDEIAAVNGVEVKLDGEAVPHDNWNRKVPVDPGAHTVIVSAPGRKAWQQTTRALEGGSVEVAVPALETEAVAAPLQAPPPPAPAPKPEVPQNTGSGQRIGAVVVGVVGVAGVAVGAILGLEAKSQWNDALANCKNGDPAHCNQAGSDLGGRASTSAAVSTVGFIVGGVGLVAAGALWLTAPSPRSDKSSATFRIAPSFDTHGGGAIAVGRF